MAKNNISRCGVIEGLCRGLRYACCDTARTAAQHCRRRLRTGRRTSLNGGNRLKVLGAKDWPAPKVTVDSRRSCKRAQAGDETILLKVTSRTYTHGIHGDEMTDKLANETADECYMYRHFHYDLSEGYTHSIKHKFWLQQTIQVQTAEGPADTKACIKDMMTHWENFAW